MRSLRMTCGSVLVVASAACAAGRPGIDDTTSGGALPFSAAVVAPGTANEAGADAPDASTAMDGGDADAGRDPNAAICPSAVVLGAGTRETFASTTDNVGLSVTPGALTAAWTTAGGTTLHYVDRATSDDPFGAPRILAGTFGTGRLALTSDGLAIAAVRPDGRGFQYLTRASLGDAFAGANDDPTASVTLDQVAPESQRFANPLFARHDTFLLYDVVSASGYVTYVSTRFRTDEPFAGGAPYVEDLLGRPGTHLVVTQASLDLRTLLVWDEDAQRTHLVTLTPANLVALDNPLGAMRDVQASSDCRTFRYASGRPLGLFEAEPK